ncbi:hypothetical protein V8J88_22745 [Massilia sp. W12]|uniref:hypothetical protein n=1 Tax=Massilia sp. W12 TaxID=3126507 RepID=UPI0030D4405D
MMENSPLLHILAQQLPEQTPHMQAFKREHIFMAILEYGKQHEELLGRMDMLRHFNLYQRCVGHIRSQNRPVVEYWMQRIQAQPLRLNSEEAKFGMQTLYLPLLGNRAYMLGDYQTACDYQQQALACINQLRTLAPSDVLAARLEQSLNLFRVYCSAGEHAQAASLAIAIISYVLGGDCNQYFPNQMLQQILPQHEWAGVADYFTRCIFNRLVSNATMLRECVQTLAQDASLAPHLSACFSLMLQAIDGESCDKTPPGFELKALPFCLQSYTLGIILRRSADAGENRQRLQGYLGILPEFRKIDSILNKANWLPKPELASTH